MDNAEFDKFAEEYVLMHKESIQISGEGPEYFAEYKILDIAKEFNITLAKSNSVKILDFGSGIGGSIPYVKKHFPLASLTCLDISLRSLEIAEQRFPKLAEFIKFDGKTIPLPTEAYDIVYAMCVFHHIDHDLHNSLLRELHRVLRTGGSLYIFEHNPLNPFTVRVVNTCPFDENAKLIKGNVMRKRLLDVGFARITIKYRVFLPHALKMLRPIEKFLTWLPLGGQYYIKGIK